jgi:hypothetical protein
MTYGFFDDRDGGGQRVKVGDVILVRGSVVEAPHTGVGVLVELYSNQGPERNWIRDRDVVALHMPELPDEPADNAWLVGDDRDYQYGGGINVFHRDDACSPHEPERRRARHWQVAGTGEWLDWPAAVGRGADVNRPLATPGSAGSGGQ